MGMHIYTHQNLFHTPQLAKCNLMAAACALVLNLPVRTTALAFCNSSICTCCSLKITLFARSVFTPSSLCIGGGITEVCLTKRCYKIASKCRIFSHRLFRHPCCQSFIVARNMGIISVERCTMHRKPVQQSSYFVIRGSGEAQQSHGCVGRRTIPGSFLGRVL